MINYYEILEVSPNASKEIIEKSYKVLAKKYHPDLNPENKKEAEEKMKKLNEAYKVLIDDQKRENYDAVFKRKQEIEAKKQAQSTNYTKNVDNTRQEPNNTVSYSQDTYVDDDNNFVINTAQMDPKTKKKIQRKLQEKYLEAYDEYLRSQGYRLKYKWTFKRVMQVVLVILITIIVFTILYFIPPINNYCHELYNNNFLVKIFVDLIASIFKSIINIFT